jgi:hypothetical protein
VSTFNDLETKYQALIDDSKNPLSLRMVTSCFLANKLDGPPVWIIVSGKSGTGKTELIMTFSEAPEHAYVVSGITPAGLLPANGIQGALDAANNKVLIVKDMSTLTQENKEDKNKLYGFLRDAYDGSIAKHDGTGYRYWFGKIGFLGASVPIIETYGDFNGQLGERFMYHRLVPLEDRALLDKIDANSGKLKFLIDELKEAGREFLDTWIPPSTTKLPTDIRNMIKDASIMIPKLRTTVFRNRANKSEIDQPIETQESPTRIFNTMKKMVVVASTLSGHTDDIAKRMIRKMLLDSLPDTRYKVLYAIYKYAKTNTTKSSIAKQLGISESVCGRYIKDLELLNILKPGTCVIADQLLLEALNEVIP